MDDRFIAQSEEDTAKAAWRLKECLSRIRFEIRGLINRSLNDEG